MNLPLVAEKISKSFGKLKAVSDLSLTLEPGEIFGLIGPNGAGKTTFISIINTLLKADSGKVSVFGNCVNKAPKLAKKITGVVPQETISHGYFNVEEILEFQVGYFGLKNMREHIIYLLKRLDLWEHRFKFARTLSGGMKRRLLIAKALVHKPKLLLLDEPTAGVDVEIRAEMWNFIKELNEKENLTILLTTHYLEEAEELCKRVGIINKGTLELIDKTDSVVHRLTSRRVTLFLKEHLVEKFEHPLLVQEKDSELTFQLPQYLSFSELLEKIKLPMVRIHDVKIQEGTLEDAFLQIIGEDASWKAT